MKFLKTTFLISLITASVSGQQITKCYFLTGWGICNYDAKGVVCLRKVIRESGTYYLTVSPSTLKTKIIRSDSIYVLPCRWEMIRFLYSSSPYIKALRKAEALSDPLQDAGYTRFTASRNGIDLTIDLCPSKRPLDRIVFTNLIDEIGKVERPVPVAISITGSWIRTHPGDLEWLKTLVGKGDLSITWINHTNNHITRKGLPLKKNFMLSPGTNVDAEVMNNEIEMIRKNLTPSVFFRFPGLVSDNRVYDRILELGLIPVGSDAWLAKGQNPGNGSIVLIHANGNEPVGVRDFIMLLKKRQKDLLSGRWELFDLRESLIEDNVLLSDQ